MIAVIVMLIMVGVGAYAAFFAPTSWNRIVFALCCAVSATGIVALILAANCIAMTDSIYGRLAERGDNRIVHNTPYDWLNHWIDPYFLLFLGGILVAFGLSVFICFVSLRIVEWRKG